MWFYVLLSQENYRIMHEAMILRGAMVPYIYTHARTAHDTGIVYHIRILLIHVQCTCICTCTYRLCILHVHDYMYVYMY